jgi:hypothetical protein
MFEMACGRPPFVRKGAGDLIIAHASEAPLAASKIQPSLPPELDQLIGRMLAKNPDDRPQTMQDVVSALDLFRVHKGAMASTKPSAPDLEEGQTSQYRRPAAPAPPDETRTRNPTAILPSSHSQSPVINSPLITEQSWIARVRQTRHDPLPRQVETRKQPARSDSPTNTQRPQTRFSLHHKGFLLSAGMLIGGVWLAVVLVVAARLKPAKPETAEVAGKAVPAKAPPSAAIPAIEPPPAPAVQPAPATPTVTKIPTVPEKASRPSHRPAASDPLTGPGAESLTAARQAFHAGDYIAAGMQAKRAAKQGAGLRAFLLLGDSMLRLESYPEAQQAFQSALALDPGNAAAKRGLRVAKQKASD